MKADGNGRDYLPVHRVKLFEDPAKGGQKPLKDIIVCDLDDLLHVGQQCISSSYLLLPAGRILDEIKKCFQQHPACICSLGGTDIGVEILECKGAQICYQSAPVLELVMELKQEVICCLEYTLVIRYCLSQHIVFLVNLKLFNLGLLEVDLQGL